MKAIYKPLSLIILLCLLSVHMGLSQNFIDKTMSKADSLVMSQRHKKANKNFEGMAYVKAIEKYEKLMQKGVGADTLKSKLATAYYKVGNTDKAEPLFREVVSGKQFIPEDLYFFAQTLKYNRKYEEADQWMDKYKQLKSNDSRSEIQHNAAPKILEIVEHERYIVNEVNFNSSKADFGPVVIGNQIVFTTGRNDEKIIRREYAWDESPYLDIYTIKKDAGALASAKLLSAKLSSAFHDGPACFSNDGNDIYFTRNNYQKYVQASDKKVIEHIGILNKITPKKSKAGVNNLMIMHAKKSGSDWDYPQALPFNSYEYSCGHPCLSPDNKTMYFASDRPGGYGGSDIYRVSLTEEGWGEPVNLGATINTEGEEMFPFVHKNGQLYFSSNGQLTLGGLDVFVAVKKDNGYEVKNMGYPLNTSSDDFSFFLEEDGIHGYFASNRDGGTGNDDIYRFEIIDKLTFNHNIRGRLLDKNSRQSLPFTAVELVDSDGLVLANLTTDSLGMIQAGLDKMHNITAVVNKKDYFPYQETFEIAEENMYFEMALNPQPYFGIFGNVFLLPDMIPIPEVSVRMEAVGGEVATIVSDKDGNFKTKLDANTSYDLVFTKKNYFTKRVHYSTVGRDTGYVNVNEFMKLEMEKAGIGKSIEIKILYDLGKWDIREDAADELDDMIQFLKDNPNIKIELGSHTDARGSATSNQILSQKRAESAVQYMVNRGISSTRITAKGYGETRLKNKCADGVPCSEEEHQVNRRSEVTIVEM